jgi:hypothetical protein
MNSKIVFLQSQLREYNPQLINHIEYYENEIENETEEATIEMLKKMLRTKQCILILNNGILNNILNARFYDSCLTNIQTANLELIELVEEHTKKYEMEENPYLKICEAVKEEVDVMTTFCKNMKTYCN